MMACGNTESRCKIAVFYLPLIVSSLLAWDCLLAPFSTILRVILHIVCQVIFGLWNSHKLSISEPDGPPQSVQGQNSSSTSILVTWNEVLVDDRNGIITNYTITYQSQTENNNGTVRVNGSARQTELTNLKKYVNYNITVFASTVKGDGPASDPIVVRTDQDSKLSFLSNFVVGVLVLIFLLSFC